MDLSELLARHSTGSSDRYIWDMLNNSEFSAVMEKCPDAFVFRREENPDKIPALLAVCYAGFCHRKVHADAVKMIRWLIERGEDAAEVTPAGVSWNRMIWKTTHKEDSKISLTAANESAVSFVLKARRLMKENNKKHGDDTRVA